MTARILVVDDIPANVRLLEARLSAEYFEVLSAGNGPDALAICDQGLCDIVLTDAMMPGMDGFEVCRRIKAAPQTAHLPVVIVTALDQPGDRLRGLEAGADDFLTKPVNEVALLARVRSLVRLKAVTDELRARAIASRDLGFGDPLAEAAADPGLGGRVLLVDDRASSSERILQTLGAMHVVLHEPDAQKAIFTATDENPDVVIVSLDLSGHDGLRLCSQLRSLDRTRHVAVLMLAEADDTGRILRGLDLGVNDYIVRPIDRNELLARVRTQVRRKRYADRLRDSVHASFELAIVDPLTGLNNRRYFDSHFQPMLDEALNRGRQLAVMLLDIDRFKDVNDTFGHEAGDSVLREFAHRIRSSVRAVDLAARLGGEEFVVLMPDTGLEMAQSVAERIRARVACEAFSMGRGLAERPVTVSIGVSVVSGPFEDVQSLLRRADDALYAAKTAGRNRVIVASRAA